jgi:uncharacterized RmlC-like cupin family protein
MLAQRARFRTGNLEFARQPPQPNRSGEPCVASKRLKRVQRAAEARSHPLKESAAIHVVRPDQFESGTTQTPGSQRLAAISPALGITSSMWAGLFEVAAGSRTAIHHHGEQDTVAFVLSGSCEVRWGANGEYAGRAQAGDFIHVPAFLRHMEINLSETEPFRWVVVRSTTTPIVVNLPDSVWP